MAISETEVDSGPPPGISKEGYDLLQHMQFRHPLRRYQKEILDLIETKLSQGERQLHLVAPPGAGKTIIGLQIISQLKVPSLILSPNTTIQSQWGQKIDLFIPPDLAAFGAGELIGTHDDKPLKPVTLLTYQVLSTPGREQEYLERLAHQSWLEELTKGRSLGVGEAELRILEILQNNPKAHQQEMSRHISRLRRKLGDVLDLKEVLHGNALQLLQSLRRQRFKLIIFDECHHLTDYWAAIMTHLVQYLEDPLIVGLTGTPPEGKSSSQETRYLSLVGEIDYQVPTPALVREGGLAPFQDLVYFTEPTQMELKFLEEQHLEFHKLIDELAGTAPEPVPAMFESPRMGGMEPQGPQPAAQTTDGANSAESEKKPTLLTAWVQKRINDAAGTNNAAARWREFLRTRPEFSGALCRYLWRLNLPLPRGIDINESLLQSPTIDDWMLLLEDFASAHLKPSKDEEHHRLYDRIRSAVRKLGYGITEQGLRRQASPVDRVLAFSNSKPESVAQILELEYKSLQDRLRAAVVTDFEKMSATSTRTLKGVLNEESGGAVATLRILLDHPIGTFINPCLVTGSLLVVDRRIRDQFLRAAQEYLSAEGKNIKLQVSEDEQSPYSEISSSSGEWESRLYVGLATTIFERGITKCLIGTRGLFGEGWDSQALNTLIDLTTTTSAVSVKQLRGRSIRIQTNDPLGGRKVANNWDVVCIAPQLEKGMNDYLRFVRKHDGYFGLCDDGQIECGVGHVHPSFSDLTPAEVFASLETFNQEMIDRALVRDKVYDMWKVGQPYNNRLLGCIELNKLRKLALTPPHLKRNMQYKEHARSLRSALIGVYAEYGGLGGLASGLLAAFLAAHGMVLLPAVLPFVIALGLGQRKYSSLFNRMQKTVCAPNTQDSSLTDIAMAVLVALQQRKFVPETITKSSIKASVRSDGSYRIFLDDVEPEQSKHFTDSLREVMAPISNQPYLIAKYEYFIAGMDTARPLDQEEFEPRPRKKPGGVTPRSAAVNVVGKVSTASAANSVGAGNDVDNDDELERAYLKKEKQFFKSYLAGKAQPRVAAYHAVPSLLARSQKGREAFERTWNKYVSPGFIIATETKPELLNRYFGIGPSLAQRLLWE